MCRAVLLTIRSEQRYDGQDTDVIELVTEGTLERLGASDWRIVYEESEITGLQGVITTFDIHPGRVVLTRTGELESEMIFEENVRHESLYRLEFGALMLVVCARKIGVELSEDGGTLEITYGIQIEQTQAGVVTYHIEVKPI